MALNLKIFVLVKKHSIDFLISFGNFCQCLPKFWVNAFTKVTGQNEEVFSLVCYKLSHFHYTLKHFIGGFKYCFEIEPFGVAELTLQRRIGFYVPLDLPLF